MALIRSFKTTDTDFTDNQKPRIKFPWEIEIKYKDYNEGITNRVVTVQKVLVNEKGTYIEGFCHLREDFRTFKASRVVGDVVDLETGELVNLKQALGK